MESSTINFSGKKILVTGGAGFIGSHLVEALLELQAKVIVTDIYIHPHSYFAINKLKEKVIYHESNILDKEELLELIDSEKIEYIFHLAAQTLVTEAYKDPYITLKVNIMGTVNVLEVARLRSSIKGIVVASSDKAYGKTKTTYTENNPLQGDHPYDVSKSSADLICQTYYQTFNIPVTVSRFGNVYGEGDPHSDRIIPGICKAVIQDNIFKIRSNGKYVRDYLYVRDVVNGYILLLKEISKTQGEAYNFSSEDTLSVIELVKKAEKILEIPIPYTILDTAQNEIPYQHLNDSKVRKLGWKTKYAINDVLPAILKWYRKVV